ncbi:MAG: hypothetical protein QQN41_03975 [Nitrosopumilus sp.]
MKIKDFQSPEMQGSSYVMENNMPAPVEEFVVMGNMTINMTGGVWRRP